MDVALTEAGPLICTECGEAASEGDLYCENCSALLPGAQVPPVVAPPEVPVPTGAALSSSTICGSCGSSDFLDGYCTQCGAPQAKERDHFAEQPAAWVAALSDRGVRHHRNEDAMALSALPEPGSRAVLVVCDGVSSSLDSDIASLAAARAARDVLTTSQQPGGAAMAGRISAWSELLTQATEAANVQAVDVAKHPTDRPDSVQNSPPSCTFVAGVVDGPLVIVGWVGDSRAYWVPDSGTPLQLTTDDSWAAEQMLSGIPRAQAESSPQAHAITRWLGTDSPDIVPRTVTTSPTSPGWLVVCSDGLWNYASAPSDLGALVLAAAADRAQDPAATAAYLVDWANEQGGQDNITVALARLEIMDDGRA